MVIPTETHFTLGRLGSQQVVLTFDGERVVTDTGLLAVRALEKPLRVLADLAERLPDPRSRKYVRHSAQALLTQEVYQILAGYPDCNDAGPLRPDPLFQILADVAPDPDHPLASGSTLARFQYAFPRRRAERPPDERPVRAEVDRAQTQRLKVLNTYLVELSVRTRRAAPAAISLDVDATDDPTHGRQALSAYHGYFRRHPSFPLRVSDGATGFPLAAWLRPGAVHASCGAADILRPIVAQLRAAWPGIRITVRGDRGLAVPALYTSGEAFGLFYVFGYGSNAVLSAGDGRGRGRRGVVLPLLRPARPPRAAVRGEPRLPGGELAPPPAGPRQDRAHAAGQPAPLGGQQPPRSPGAAVPGGVRAARGGARAADRGDEERPAGGAAECLWVPGQRLPLAGAYGGLCPGGAVPRSGGGGAGGGAGDREYPAAPAGEGGGGGAGRRAADLVAGVGDQAGAGLVAAGVRGGGRVRGRGGAAGGARPGGGRAAHVTNRGERGRPTRLSAQRVRIGPQAVARRPPRRRGGAPRRTGPKRPEPWSSGGKGYNRSEKERGAQSGLGGIDK